jgi:microcystin-dependent protein
MADPFLAEIRIFPFTFPPKNWAFCNGQLLPISQNTALFALLGTVYGGDGKSTFALPDFQGCAPMHPGQGPGLSARDHGESSGSSTVTLIASEMPAHTHVATASTMAGTTQVPTNQMLAAGVGVAPYGTGTPTTAMSPQSIAPAGASVPHNNMQPFLTFHFCIALQGVFPQRS